MGSASRNCWAGGSTGSHIAQRGRRGRWRLAGIGVSVGRRTCRPKNTPSTPDACRRYMKTTRCFDSEIGRLPERYRTVVVLCYLQGQTHEEAARRLRRPIGTISARLSRARDLLRGRLVRRGLAPAGILGALAAGSSASAAPSSTLLETTVQAAIPFAAGRGVHDWGRLGFGDHSRGRSTSNHVSDPTLYHCRDPIGRTRADCPAGRFGRCPEGKARRRKTDRGGQEGHAALRPRPSPHTRRPRSL